MNPYEPHLVCMLMNKHRKYLNEDITPVDLLSDVLIPTPTPTPPPNIDNRLTSDKVSINLLCVFYPR